MRNPFKKLKKTVSEEQLKCGLYSKHDAVKIIGEGIAHLHSSMLGERDACAQMTQKALDSGQEFRYSWERDDIAKTISIRSSRDRHTGITNVLGDMGLINSNTLTERVRLVLEELLSNSIYHSYRDSAGVSKYDRTQQADLAESEGVTVRYSSDNDGVYLGVQDAGGTLTFQHLCHSFLRCYERGGKQIENKEDGAGLGLYMIFESVMHLKVEVVQQKWTRISCWIPGKRRFDPDNFSFNFFSWGIKGND